MENGSEQDEGRWERRRHHHSMVSAHIFVMENIFVWLFVSPPYRSEKMFSFISFFVCIFRRSIEMRWDGVEKPLLKGIFTISLLFISFRGPFQSRSVGFYCISSFQISGERDIQILMVTTVSWSGQARNYIWFELYLWIFGYDSSKTKTRKRKNVANGRRITVGMGMTFGQLYEKSKKYANDRGKLSTVHLWKRYELIAPGSH